MCVCMFLCLKKRVREREKVGKGLCVSYTGQTDPDL